MFINTFVKTLAVGAGVVATVAVIATGGALAGFIERKASKTAKA